jgi:CelD/BcsL family acetyltransferase involved in cellulose biosynthesis
VTGGGAELEAEIIDNPDRLRELESDWRALAEGRGNVFITPEWLFAWRRHYGSGAKLAVAAVRRRDALVGVVPLARARVRRGGTLRFCGANLADHLHPVAQDEHADAEVAAAAGARLGGPASAWTAIVLDNVDVGAEWVRAMTSASPSVASLTTSRQSVLPYVALPGAWEEYLVSRSRNFRSEIGRKLRRLEREHEVRFRLSTDPSELAGDLDTFFRLHDARWDPRGGSSSRSERARAFHTDFSGAALRRGWLRLWVMEIDGEPVASWYGWRLGERYSYYLAGFSPRWADASVGLLLLAHTVRSAIEEGASEYDMLLGEEPYKRRFATAERSVETVVITPARHPMRLVAGAEAMLWRGYRRLPPGARGYAAALARAVRERLPSSRER